MASRKRQFADVSEPPALTPEAIFGLPDEASIESSVQTALRKLKRETTAFEKKYDGHLHRLTHSQLGHAIDEYHAFGDLCLYISNRIAMAHITDHGNEKMSELYHQVMDAITDHCTRTIFFLNQLAALENDHPDQYEALLNSRMLTDKGKEFIQQMAASYEVNFSEETERALAIVSPLMTKASDMYEEVMTAATFQFDGRDVSYAELIDIIGNDEDINRRKKASEALQDFFKSPVISTLMTNIYNTAIQTNSAERQMRGYQNVESEYHLNNGIGDAVAKRMVRAVRNSKAAENYFALKAAKLGKDTLDIHDAWSPAHTPPKHLLHKATRSQKATDNTISWDDAVRTVTAAYNRFSPEMGALAEAIFDNGWVDAKPRKGKEGGYALAYNCGESDHPWVFINYHGRFEDVATLAHEVGHAIGFMLANKEQGNFMNSQTTLITEVAASMGEELLFDELEEHFRRLQKSEALDAIQEQRMENTLSALMLGHHYNMAVDTHQASQGGTRKLSTGEINQAWVRANKRFFGKSVDAKSIKEMGWCGVAHFSMSPFYLGDYAMTKLITLSVLDKADTEERRDALANSFVDFLKYGGSKETSELLNGIGFNINSPTIWKRCMKIVERQVDELETIHARHGKSFVARVSASRTDQAERA